MSALSSSTSLASSLASSLGCCSTMVLISDNDEQNIVDDIDQMQELLTGEFGITAQSPTTSEINTDYHAGTSSEPETSMFVDVSSIDDEDYGEQSSTPRSGSVIGNSFGSSKEWALELSEDDVAKSDLADDVDLVVLENDDAEQKKTGKFESLDDMLLLSSNFKIYSFSNRDYYRLRA